MSFPSRLLRSLALVVLASPAGALPQEHAIAVSRLEGKSGPLWNVLCEDAPLDEVLRTLAKKAGLALEGSELLPRGATVTLELEHRPLERVLEYLLGGAGFQYELARGSLVLRPPTNDPVELLRRAQAAWKDVEAAGDERASARARLAQGNLAEVSGDREGAYQLYQELAEDEPLPEAAEASYRAGRMLEDLGHWAEAAQRFRTLAGQDFALPFHSRARLELARVSIELGDAASALHLLNFLDSNYRSDDARELAERRLVRARAHNAGHEYVEALRTLEEGETIAAEEAEARSLEVRATAFQGLGFDVEAARAWLLYARAARPAEREAAFERSARLSLEAGDELGTLFIVREAAKAGADQGLGALARTARARLGLDEAEAPTSIVERLALAERHLAAEELPAASELFEGLYLARGALEELDRARVLAGWSRCVLERSGLEPALEVLAKGRATTEDPDALQRLDLAAAALLESEGEYERAAEAYRGVY